MWLLALMRFGARSCSSSKWCKSGTTDLQTLQFETPSRNCERPLPSVAPEFFTLTRIRILLLTLIRIRIRIRLFILMRIRKTHRIKVFKNSTFLYLTSSFIHVRYVNQTNLRNSHTLVWPNFVNCIKSNLHLKLTLSKAPISWRTLWIDWPAARRAERMLSPHKLVQENTL